MKRIYLDPDSDLVQECFAVVFAPRRHRDRFPENCVEVTASREVALQQSQPENKQFAAKVMGPSRSSEGLRLYYLIEWLD